jgi:hypothetical protein
MRKVMILSVCILMTAFAVNANSATITFTDEGTASGTLNGVSFSNENFTITATADTTGVVSFPFDGDEIHAVVSNSASINISGVGTSYFTVGVGTDFFVNNTLELVGFGALTSLTPAGEVDLFDGPGDASFSTWAMLSSIGPISGSGALGNWSATPVTTDNGILVFNDCSGFATFQATVSSGPSVAEPCTILLIGSGLAGLAAFRKKLGA